MIMKIFINWKNTSHLHAGRKRTLIKINCIALKFDRCLGISAADVPVEFQNNRTILITNLAASGLQRSRKILCQHHDFTIENGIFFTNSRRKRRISRSRQGLSIRFRLVGANPKAGILGTNFNEIVSEIHAFSFKKCIWKCRLRNSGHFEMSQCSV